jgi:hypothetical protein
MTQDLVGQPKVRERAAHCGGNCLRVVVPLGQVTSQTSSNCAERSKTSVTKP